MSKLTKNQKTVLAKYEPEKIYRLSEACEIVKEISYTKFDASVEMAIKLGVDPKKANQMVRGSVSLPHGTGKTVKVLVLCPDDKQAEAKAAGADFVGLDDYIEKIEKEGWFDMDIVICTPQVMPKLGKLASKLGPRGLMPNPKSGTVTMEVGKAVKEVKAGKINFKVDKLGNINAAIAKTSFTAQQILENANEFLGNIIKLKPQALKGSYIISISMSSTMSPGIKVDTKSVGNAE